MARPSTMEIIALQVAASAKANPAGRLLIASTAEFLVIVQPYVSAGLSQPRMVDAFDHGVTALMHTANGSGPDYPREEVARLALSHLYGFECEGESLCEDAERVLSTPNPRAVRAVAFADAVARLLGEHG